MQVIKIILFVIIGIVVLVLLVALFVRKDYLIKREIVINRPNGEVFEYVRFLKNQDNFSKWVMTDPGMQKQYSGVDGQPGFVYAWDSKDDKVGKGEQELKTVERGKKVGIEIRFKKPFESVAQAEMKTASLAPSQTKVEWSMHGESKYPMNITNMFIDGILGPDLEKSLATLKDVLEK